MKRQSWLSTATLAVLALTAIGARAQDTAPTEGSEAQETEKAPEREKLNEVSIGYTGFRSNTALSYGARVPEGLALHYLRLVHPGDASFPYARFAMSGMPKQDNTLGAFIAFNKGHTVFRGHRSEFGYYVDDWRTFEPSTDNESQFSLEHSFTPGFGAFVTYRADKRNAQYPAPKENENVSSRLIAGGVGGTVFGGHLDVSAAERKTTDDNGVRPDSLQRTIGASYGRDFGDTFSLDGQLAYSRIMQAGLDDSTVKTYALGGAWDMGPDTTLQFRFGRQDLDLPNVRNAFVQKRLVSGAKLLHRFPGWSLQVGFQHKESERMRTDHTFVDVPKSNLYDARLSGRLGPARVTFRGSWEDFRETAVMNTTDTRQLLWDDRAMFQAKADWGNETVSAYGAYTYRMNKNSQRDVEVGWNNVVFGGSYVVNPAVNLYAEFSADDFRVTGGDPAGGDLDFYFPNSRTYAVGLNWSQDPSLSASANLDHYESGDVRGTRLTLSVRRRLSPAHDLELVVAPWQKDDRLYDLTGYRTTIVSARFSVRF
ncbi:MAG: hypothetical protein JST30_09610 [Armatimonadetes bacterium]|nr:hypothetical protein [Armatimonadota bacterium]